MPPYSPDINVIELVWAEMKRYLRKRLLKTPEEIMSRVEKYHRKHLTVDKCRAYISRVHTVIYFSIVTFYIICDSQIFLLLLGFGKNHSKRW